MIHIKIETLKVENAFPSSCEIRLLDDNILCGLKDYDCTYTYIINHSKVLF